MHYAIAAATPPGLTPQDAGSSPSPPIPGTRRPHFTYALAHSPQECRMATITDHRKLVRVVAFNAKNVNTLKTVNVSTTAPTSKHQAKECVQLTAAQTVSGEHPTVMAAAAVTPGLPTVFINGYTGPL